VAGQEVPLCARYGGGEDLGLLASDDRVVPAVPDIHRGCDRLRDGQVEAIRALMVAKRTARAQRTQAINQARALIITGPDDIRGWFTGQGSAELVAELSGLRPPSSKPRPARNGRAAKALVRRVGAVGTQRPHACR
jgi:hypothetical protein